MIILGIETTCDETGVGVVRDGREILSNVVASSASMHKKYGGIVPEVAAREQVRVIIPALKEALMSANLKPSEIDAISVSHGPGLIGPLLVGVETAKVLATVWGKPLVSANHLLGHIFVNWSGEKNPKFPLVALIVSGGHTDLVYVESFKKIRWLGGTLDDACGEAFDKVARILGLGYPGGPQIEKLSQKPKMKVKIKLPRPMIDSEDFNFSFSGLKTAVVNQSKKFELNNETKSAIAYEFQESVFDVLVSKTIKAAKKFNAKSIVIGGGVAANNRLKERFKESALNINIAFFAPPRDLSVDNGAMIASAAFYQKKYVEPLKLQADPSLYF